MFDNINKGVGEYRSTPGAVLVDVREPDEFAAGHIPDAVNLPLSELQRTSSSEEPASGVLSTLFPKESQLFLYCLRGSRSMRAAVILKKMGYQHVKSIGGINRYKGTLER